MTMPFVKLDCGMLDSTIWFEQPMRDVFITALLMAEPFVTDNSIPQLHVDSLKETGWEIPPGWYGFVRAAGPGIVARSLVEQTAGMEALRRLGEPESASRSQEFEGRRLIRVDGGYVVLNYMKYRDRDYTTAERSKRYRERQAKLASRRGVSASRRDITQAEAEAEGREQKKNEDQVQDQDLSVRASRSLTTDDFDAFWLAYPKKTGKRAAEKAWTKAQPPIAKVLEALAWQTRSDQWNRDNGQYRPNPVTYLNQGRWEDEPENPAAYVPDPNTKTGRMMLGAKRIAAGALALPDPFKVSR